MKTKSLLRLIVVLALCLSVLCIFTSCKDDEIYAGSDDFQSYPEYWNDFNDDSGDIFIPNTSSKPSSSDGSDTSSFEDFTANFTDDDEIITSSDINTGNDNTPDDKEPDDNNSSSDDNGQDDNNSTPDDEEKPDYGNQGPLVFF